MRLSGDSKINSKNDIVNGKNILVVFMLFVLCLNATADTFDNAMSAYHNKNYKLAMSLFQKEAESNNYHAQTQIGVMYYYGQGVKQDYAIAYQWFEKAAKNGSIASRYIMDDMKRDALIKP